MTQPRRIAAITVSKRVAEELGDVTFDADPALKARVYELEQSLGETHAKLRQTQAQLRFDAMRTDDGDW